MKITNVIKPVLASCLFIFLMACSVPKNEKITLQKGSIFERYNKDKHAVADFLEDYLNLMYDSSAQTRNNLWDSEIYFNQQDRHLFSGVKKEHFLSNPPHVLGIRSVNDYYLLKLAFQNEGFTQKIMNLKIKRDPLNRFYFEDQLSQNLKKYNKYTVDGYDFFYSPKIKRDTVGELKTIEYSKTMAQWFERPEKKLRIITVSDSDEYAKLQGYDYLGVTSQDINKGGLAVPDEDLYFSQNGKPFYPHEIVHCYSDLQNDFYWFDEGLATYFGGSVGHPLNYHLTKLADSIDEQDFSMIPKDKLYDKTTTYKYAIGGLFMKLANEQYGGKDTMLKLMNYGREEKDFFAAIEDVFGVEKDEIDAFVKKELMAYKTPIDER